MTTTTDLRGARPENSPDPSLFSSDGAAARISARCLRDGPVGRIGLELEAHCFDAADPRRRPSWDELTDVIDGIAPLPGGSAITVEPGGAVELSGPPFEGPLPAISAMQSDRAIVRKAFTRSGFGLVLLGADPLRPSGRVNPSERYRAMERFFAPGGSAGAAMMTSTASVQVNVEAGPRADWADRLRLAHALGPTMIAISANSPLLGAKFSGWRSTRQRVWSQLDPARCGPVSASADDPADDWARYALNAPVMLVQTPDVAPVTDAVPFADWVDGRTRLGDRQPTHADLDYHLTTLFPPVRPRGYLEIRYLDSTPDAVWPAVVFTLATLLDDPVAADVAAEATQPVATDWDLAARVGLADRRLRAAAIRCVGAAAARAPRELHVGMERLVNQVEQGRSAADDFSDLVVDRGIDMAVRQLTEDES